MLVALAWMLLSIHGPTAPSGAAPGDTHALDAPAASRSLEADDVVDALARTNPALSRPELERIARAVMRSSRKYGLDPALVTAVIQVESSARPEARSPKGAIGLMQVMPHMLEPLRLAGNFATVESNIEAGCLILAHNIARLGERDGILAYFWGSEIRGTAYFERVAARRAEIQRRLRL